MTLASIEYWLPLIAYLCYLSSPMFSSSILCFLVFEFPKKHKLLACAMFVDVIMLCTKFLVCI